MQPLVDVSVTGEQGELGERLLGEYAQQVEAMRCLVLLNGHGPPAASPARATPLAKPSQATPRP
jgi:hypothetical protein